MLHITLISVWTCNTQEVSDSWLQQTSGREHMAAARLGAVGLEVCVHLLSRVYVSNLCGKSHSRP